MKGAAGPVVRDTRTVNNNTHHHRFIAMKQPLVLAAIALTTLSPLSAGPLQSQHLAAETKWVLHLDAQAFRGTKIGETIARDLIDPKMTKSSADLKAWFDFDFDWRRISGVTLYGTDYAAPEKERGVALIYTDMDLAQGLDSAIDKLTAVGAAEAGSVKRLEGGEQPLYQVNDAFIAVLPGLAVVAGKNREQVVHARAVMAGRAPKLNGSPAFTQFLAPGAGFFFLGAAEGFNESAPIPPQAKVLKMADGLRLTLAEANSQVVANLALLARDAQTSQQMQQVVQGLVALVSLSQTDNQDLQQLAQSTRVQQSDRLVTLELALPVSKVAEKIAEKAKH